MSKVKWIKITTDIFDNRKIRQIECMPEGDSIIVIWVKLLCLAGMVNDNGLVYVTKDVPYTDQMLSYQFNRPLSVVQSALKLFEQLGMIDISDNILMVSNWEKYQNVEGMERVREQNRIRKQQQREREKLLLSNSHVMSRDSHATDIDIELEKEREEEKRFKEKKQAKKESPSYFPEDEKLESAFLDFIENRKKLKKPMSDRAIELAISKLEKLSQNALGEFDRDKAVEILEQSILGGWTGLYELGGKKQSKSSGGIDWDNI